VVGAGVVKLAQMTGARIIPVSYSASRKLPLKSWDRFVLVKPFGRIHVAFGEPIEVPRRISPEGRRGYVDRVERTLLHLDRVCVEKVGGGATESPEATSVSVASHSQERATSQEARAG
jgi:1-acyl-sn-glycerol-3-phosphate acyltransferase